MPTRSVITLDRFRTWAQIEEVFPDTRRGSAAAMQQHATLSNVDLEATALVLRYPNGDEVSCFTPASHPFVLRPLPTPTEEFRSWRPQQGGGFVLEPCWRVAVVSDPLRRARRALEKEARAFLYVRTYVAAQRYAATRPEFAALQSELVSL